MLKSPFRYPGGKSKRAVQEQILDYIPFGVKEYREPFVGGGGIFFGLEPTKVQKRWINDINAPLIEVYTAFRDRPEDFIKACRDILPIQPNEPEVSTKTEKGKKYNARLGKHFQDFAYNETMDQALRYFFINRTVWAGRVNYNPEFASRMYYSNPTGWNITQKPEFLEAVAAHLQGTRISCGPYKPLLDEPGEDVWIYLDPPYVVDTNLDKGSKLYQFGFTKEDHEQFAAACRACPHKLCISYDDVPDVRELFKEGFFIYEHSWKYSGTSNDIKTDGKELIITNYRKPGEQLEFAELFDSV